MNEVKEDTQTNLNLRKRDFFVNEFEVNEENVIIVTSCINGKSVFPAEERIKHVKRTIKNLREKVPSFKIFLLEMSDMNDSYCTEMASLTDYFVKVDSSIRKFNTTKNAGECILTMKALSMLGTKVKNLLKISGRYYLNDNFSLNNFDFEKFNFCVGWDSKCYDTMLYNIPVCRIGDLFEILKSIFIQTTIDEGMDIEHCYFSKIPKQWVCVRESLGCEGLQAGGNLYTI